MKKITSILLTMVMLLSLLAGCTGGGTETQPTTMPTQESTQATTQPTEATTAPTEAVVLGSANTSSAQILSKIWTAYDENERFASYGGTVEHSVSDAPGDLDMTNTEEIITKYLLPTEQLANVESGASLVHLMNSNIFSAAAFKLKEGADMRTAAKALRDNIQKTRWLCGQPDHLLVADVDGHLLMAFAEKGIMDTFRQKLKSVYTSVSIIYDEAVTA